MSKTPEIANTGLSYTKPDAFGKPRSHFYATNSMLNYQYGGPMLNSVKHVFGEGGFKSMAKNIPSPYKFAGTKIYRDTTEIPSFKQGGNLEQPWLNNLYPNGGQLYTYADRPEAVYQKDEKGNWLIKLPSTNGQFVPLNDPTSKRAGELNEKAVLMPSQFRKQYDAFKDTKPQVAENTALPNLPQSDPTLIDQTVAQKQAERAVVAEKIKADPLLTDEQKLAIITNPQKLDENVNLAYAPGPGQVKAYTPTQQSVGSKMADIAFNPMTSLGYWMRGQEIPDNLQRRLDYGLEDRNPLDMVSDVTPLGAAHSANNIYTKATDDIDGNFWTANTALDALNLLPTAGILRNSLKGLTPKQFVKEITNEVTAIGKHGRQLLVPSKATTKIDDVPTEVPVVKPKQTKEELDKYINDLADKYKKEGEFLFPPAPEKTFGSMVSNQMDWNNFVQNFNNNPLDLRPINLRHVGNGFYLDGYVNSDLGKGGRSLKPANTGLFGMPAETLKDFAPANPEHIFTTPIAQNSLEDSLEAAIASPVSLGLETIGSLIFKNRANTLREAENWMNNWVQHPATQAKIAASHELGKTLPREEYKSIFSGPDVPQQFTVARSPLESHNLNQAILSSANYDATGRLQEYPLKQQVSDLLQFRPGIHSDNIGTSYTHRVNPGQWINPGNTLDPSINVNNSYNMENADGTPSAEAFPRYGNWISRRITPSQRLSTGIHELTHDFGRAATLKSTGQDKVLTDAVDQDVVAAMKEKHRTDGKKLADIIYYTDPTEIHARVMQARHHFDLTPDQTVTPEMAGNMMKDIKKGKTKIDSDWANYFTDNEKIATMFNKAWMAPAAIVGGTAATLLNNPWASKEQPMGLRQGGMLKRADGSYSQRGLWDNIRANAGSGKEPTKEMLAQERKINNEYRNGGKFQTSYYSSDVNDNYYTKGGPLTQNQFTNIDIAPEGTREYQIVNQPKANNYDQQFIDKAIEAAKLMYQDLGVYDEDDFLWSKMQSAVNPTEVFKLALNNVYNDAYGKDRRDQVDTSNARYHGSQLGTTLMRYFDAAISPDLYPHEQGSTGYGSDIYNKKIEEPVRPEFKRDAMPSLQHLPVANIQYNQPEETPVFNRTFKSGGSLPKPYSLPEDSFRQGGNNLHNSIYASTPGQYPQPYENGGSLLTNSELPKPKPTNPNIVTASQFNVSTPFHPETYTDIEKSDGTTYKKGLDGAWYISGPRAKDYRLLDDPAGIWADSLETGIRQAKVIPISEMPL